MRLTIENFCIQIRILPILIFCFFISLPACGGGTVKVDDSLSFLSISPATEYFQDSSGTMTFSEIQNTRSDDFMPWNGERYSLGLFNDILWIRFRIEKKGEQEALLSITKLMPVLDIYLPQRSNSGIEYVHHTAGNFNNTKRLFPYRYPVLPITDKISAEDYIYIRIQPFTRTDHVSLDFSIDLVSKQTFYLKAVAEVAVMLFLIGGLFALGLYNLFLALYLKIRIYRYYVAYIFSMILFILIRSRILAIFEIYRIHLLVLPIIAVTYFLSLVFSRIFLETRKNLPRLDKVILFIMFLCPVVLIFLLTGMPLVTDIILHILTIVTPLVVISSGIARYRQGYAPARYYLSSWIVLGIAVLLSGIGTGGLGIIPSYIDLEFIMAIGAQGEALLISLALADRIHILQLENIQLANRGKYLSEISLKDELTGLFNKRMYLRSISRDIETSRKNNVPLSLLILDIDHFKFVNDKYGHVIGDKVLKNLADTFISCLRIRDVACRYGGEEFVIILPETSLNEALFIAERLREQSAAAFVESLGQKINRTVSIGVTVLDDEDTPDDLFERADRALYTAKKGGRDKVIPLTRETRSRNSQLNQ